MTEKELINNVSNYYGKFFNLEKRIYPKWQCTNEIQLKILKLGMKLLNYGVCDKCQRINFYSEIKEYSQGNYNQIWQKLPSQVIKSEFEKQLDLPINEKDLEFYSKNFDEILTKLDELVNDTMLAKTKFQNMN